MVPAKGMVNLEDISEGVSVMDAFGNAENVTKGMPGIRTENDGFFLHVEERIARQGRMAGCLLVVD